MKCVLCIDAQNITYFTFSDHLYFPAVAPAGYNVHIKDLTIYFMNCVQALMMTKGWGFLTLVWIYQSSDGWGWHFYLRIEKGYVLIAVYLFIIYLFIY